MVTRIEKIVHGGYGLAHIDGKVCLLPYTVTGDQVEVECSSYADYGVGWVKRIISPSMYRQSSLCPNFSRCGGCDFEHIIYPYEIAVKQQILQEDLLRFAGSTIERVDVIFGPGPYHYRNHAQFKVDNNGKVGFFMKRSREVVPVPERGCLLLDQHINEYLKQLHSHIQFKRGGFRIRVNTKGELFSKGIPELEDDRYYFFHSNGIKLRVGINDFFQVNNRLYEKWLSRINLYLAPEKNESILELFCGSGFITLYLAKLVKRIIGMEISGSAIRNARFNAISNTIYNAEFKRVNLQHGFSNTGTVEKIVADPPRAGLTKALIHSIVAMGPERIVYVSCNTATFARDVRRFVAQGYRISQATIADMFPRTAHIEVIAQLIRD